MITNGIDTPENLAVTNSNRLFVQNSGAVSVYDNGATSPSYRINNPKGLGATGVVVGSEGNAYVPYATAFSSGSGCGYVGVFPPGSNTPSLKITDGVCDPEYVAIDASNNLYVESPTKLSDTLTIYEPGDRKLIATLSNFGGYWLAFNDAGRLWAAVPPIHSCKTGSVVLYNSTWTSITRTLTAGAACYVSGQIAVDGHDNLFVPGGVNVDEVSVFEPGSDQPARELTTDLLAPTYVAVDSSNNVYVGNIAECSSITCDKRKNAVVVFPPGSNTPLKDITNGISSPTSLAIY